MKEQKFLKETVIVVHGTFDGPKAGVVKWFEPDGEFCRELDRHLEEHGSLARCWAHCRNNAEDIFTWDGRNRWSSRYDSAIALHRYSAQLREQGWLCHFVAHSHGGNVVLRAFHQEIARYLHNRLVDPREEGISIDEYRSQDSWYRSRIGEIVCLGTPFLEMPQFDHIWLGPTRTEESLAMLRTLFLNSVAIVAAVYLFRHRPTSDSVLAWTIIMCSMIVIGIALYWVYYSIGMLASSFLLRRRMSDVKEAQQMAVSSAHDVLSHWTHLLVQSSPHDEAYILLRSFLPLRIAIPSPLSRLIKRWSTWMHETSDVLIDGFLYGVGRKNEVQWAELKKSDPRKAIAIEVVLNKAAVVALSLGFLVAILCVSSLLSRSLRWDIMLGVVAMYALMAVFLRPDHLTRIRNVLKLLFNPFRQLLSAVLLQMVVIPVGYRAARRSCYGLEDFPHRAEITVDHIPFWHSDDFYLYEPVQMVTTRELLSARQTWLDELIRQIPDIASSDDVNAVLKRIAANKSLVHSAYMRGSRNIERIAQFIARRQ